jgi:hypothetical protein
MSINQRLLTATLTLITATTATTSLPSLGDVKSVRHPIRTTANRDKTGTISVNQNGSGLQMVTKQPLASSVSFQAEGKGFEQLPKIRGFQQIRQRALQNPVHSPSMIPR